MSTQVSIAQISNINHCFSKKRLLFENKGNSCLQLHLEDPWAPSRRLLPVIHKRGGIPCKAVSFQKDIVICVLTVNRAKRSEILVYPHSVITRKAWGTLWASLPLRSKHKQDKRERRLLFKIHATVRSTQPGENGQLSRKIYIALTFLRVMSRLVKF